MTLIFAELGEVGLDGLAALEKQTPHGVTRNPADKCFCLVEHAADASVKIGNIDEPLGRQHAEVFHCKSAISSDIGEHFLWRLSGKTSDSGADYGPKRQNAFMNRQKVEDVAGFTTVGRGGSFVRGKVGRV